MRLTKSILILTFSALCALCFVLCAYAAGEDITVVGDTRAKTVSLESTALPVLGSEGEIRYNPTDKKLYVWDGSQWKPLTSNRNVATRIVGVDRNRDGIVDAGDSLDIQRADHVCDGTDDQKEINQAIIDIIYSPTTPINKAKQGVVYLLDGTYNISNTTFSDYVNPQGGAPLAIATPGIVMQSGISLIGAGKGTELKAASTNLKVINASSVNNVLISQLMVNGDAKSSTYGVYFTSVTDSKIEKIWIDFVNSVYGVSMVLLSSSNNVISHNNILRSNGGVLISSSNNNIFSNNRVWGIYNMAVEVADSDYNLIANNEITNSRCAIYMTSYAAPTSGPSDYNVFFGNILSNNSDEGISVAYGENNVITANMASNNGWRGFLVAQGNNVISGNVATSNGREGIWLSNVNNSVISGNVLYNNGQNDSGKAGIYAQNSDRNLIASNYISDTAGTAYGINISSANCDENYIVSNQIIPWSGWSGAIFDSGTGTKYTGKEKITLERAASQDPGSGGTITPGAASYVPLNPGSAYALNATTAINDGKAEGDLLILENISASTITIPNNANTKLGAARALARYDNVVLIWKADSDPAKSNWLELSYWDN